MNLIAVLVLGSALTQAAHGREAANSNCPDKAVRILAIGGEIQANTWPAGSCDKSGGKRDSGRHLGWDKHHERQAQERAEYSRRKEVDKKNVEASARHHRDEESKRTEAKKKEDDKKKSDESKRKRNEQKRSEAVKGKTNGHKE